MSYLIFTTIIVASSSATYHKGPTLETHEKAFEYCFEYGSELATIEAADWKDATAACVVEHDEGCWVGYKLHDSTKGTWEKSTGGLCDASQYGFDAEGRAIRHVLPWHSIQPDFEKTNEECVHMYNYHNAKRYNDWPCYFHQYPLCNARISSKIFVPPVGEYFQLQNVGSNKCMSLNYDHDVGGKYMTYMTNPCSGRFEDQWWKLDSSPNGYYVIKNKESNKCFWSENPGEFLAALDYKACDENDEEQHWELTIHGKGLRIARSTEPKNILEENGGRPGLTAGVHFRGDQLWKFINFIIPDNECGIHGIKQALNSCTFHTTPFNSPPQTVDKWKGTAYTVITSLAGVAADIATGGLALGIKLVIHEVNIIHGTMGTSPDSSTVLYQQLESTFNSQFQQLEQCISEKIALDDARRSYNQLIAWVHDYEQLQHLNDLDFMRQQMDWIYHDIHHFVFEHFSSLWHVYDYKSYNVYYSKLPVWELTVLIYEIIFTNYLAMFELLKVGAPDYVWILSLGIEDANILYEWVDSMQNVVSAAYQPDGLDASTCDPNSKSNYKYKEAEYTTPFVAPVKYEAIQSFTWGKASPFALTAVRHSTVDGNPDTLLALDLSKLEFKVNNKQTLVACTLNPSISISCNAKVLENGEQRLDTKCCETISSKATNIYGLINTEVKAWESNMKSTYHSKASAFQSRIKKIRPIPTFVK